MELGLQLAATQLELLHYVADLLKPMHIRMAPSHRVGDNLRTDESTNQPTKLINLILVLLFFTLVLPSHSYYGFVYCNTCLALPFIVCIIIIIVFKKNQKKTHPSKYTPKVRTANIIRSLYVKYITM